MYTLLEVGLGQLSLWQDEAVNSESLAGTKFNDLDAMFAFLGISRLPQEMYVYDPYHDQLTVDQWNEIFSKDSLFRNRISKFFQSMLRGGTLEGIQMMAEAASGVECQIFEMWRVLNGRGLAAGTSLGRRDSSGNLLLNLAKEFVIVPLEDINDNQRSAIIHLVDLLKPVNTISTVHTSPVLALQELVVRFSASRDHYFEVRYMVTASDDLIFESQDIWIQPKQEVEAPTFALMDHHDAEWSLNESVSSIKTFGLDDFNIAYGTLDTSNLDIQNVEPNLTNIVLPNTGDEYTMMPYVVPSIDSVMTTIVVNETSEPVAPAFSIKIDDEEMFVTDRVPVVNQNTKFTYTVIRGENGTTPSTHMGGTQVFSGAVRIYSEEWAGGIQYGPWRPIPSADSPDNFPSGQYSGDPAKFDAQGNYNFDYSSQDEFLAWFTAQINSIDGQVNGTQYRLPAAVESVGGTVTTPNDALAPPEFFVQTRIYPDAI